MGCAKFIFLCKVAYLFHTVLAIAAESAPPAGGQPFLNSLAVLFRSRPPWPTTFPSATSLYSTPPKQTGVAVSSAPIPPNMLPGAPKQGILVAHPLNNSPMLTNNLQIKNSNNNQQQQIHSPSSNSIKAIRSPNPHSFPNNQNNPSQIQPAGGTISLTPIQGAGPGQGPPHKPGFITIAVKRPMNGPFMPPIHPPNMNFDGLNPPSFNNLQPQQQQPPHLQLQQQQNQNQPPQFQNHQDSNQNQPQSILIPFQNKQQHNNQQSQIHQNQQQHNNQQSQIHQNQQQSPLQNSQNPFQTPQSQQQPFHGHQQVVELDQHQQGQQLQQLQQQLEQQQKEQQFQQQQNEIEAQKQEQQKFHPQQFDEPSREHHFQSSQQVSLQAEQNDFNRHQNNENENYILTTTPPPPTIKPIVDHFRISNRDFNSKYKPTTKSPMKLVTAPLLSSLDMSGNGGNGFPDPPTPPVFQSFSDNSITRSSTTYSNIDWPKNSKFDSDYFDNNNIVSNDINNVDHVSSQTSTVGTRIKVSEGPNQSENLDNLRKGSISSLGSPTKLSPVRKSKVLSNFRPSPQLHSFEDTTTGLKSYISVPNDLRERERDGKMSSGFQASEAKYYPPYESGFRPIPFNHYAFLYGKTGATPKSQLENSIRQQYYSPWGSISTSTASTLPERTDRKLVHGTLSQLLLASDIVNQASATNSPFTHLSSSRNPSMGRQATTSSSETIEDWISGPHNNRRAPKGSKRKFPIFAGKTRKRKAFLPKKCEKFHRFGFCPVTAHYPLETVEKIAVRCSALLSHLIAPLPRADVRYDIIVSKNGSLLKGQSEKESGWSWKSFAGRPVCDTKEIKIIPGFAKNEAGEWLVVLQTEVFKQEAQISLCSPQGPNCRGGNCREEEENPRRKCVQRFTAQRLAVLDPEDQERCPVVRSVFLPSACVCLTDPNENNQRQQQEQQQHESVSYVEEDVGGNAENSRADDFESGAMVLEKRRKDPLEDLVTADSSRYAETELGEPELEEASSSVEREPRVSASNYIPVISVENPVANSTFMIITEKFTTNESSSSTESAESHRVSLSVSTTPNSIDDYL